MTKKNEILCWIGISITYSLILALFLYMVFSFNKVTKVEVGEPVKVEAPNPITVEVTPAPNPIAVKVTPSKKNMEVLIAESIKGKYVETISTTVLKESQKYRLPIWFIMATTCTESEDWSGNVNPRAYNKRCNARGCLQITPVCLKEYNDWHKVKYTMDDMWNVVINYEVGCWYLARIRDHYFKNLSNWSYEDVYIAFNVGPSSFKAYRRDYYNGYDVVRHCDYNALNRFRTYQEKYLEYFNLY